MNTLQTKSIFSFRHNESDVVADNTAGLPISCSPCHVVNTYEDLLYKISSLNFYNSSMMTVFRGQSKDYYSNGDNGKPLRSNLYPSLMRSLPVDKNKRREKIRDRVKILNKADELLKKAISTGYINKHQLVRWAILQHYEICPTPLLDVTESLQTALSFALNSNTNEGFLYVLGLPHATGPITVSIESMTQLVDLSKLCPPEVARPHFQNGLLIADYPTALNTEELITHAPKVSSNFSCRLLAKFHLKNTQDWFRNGFKTTPDHILYPNKIDIWYKKLEDIKTKISV